MSVHYSFTNLGTLLPHWRKKWRLSEDEIINGKLKEKKKSIPLVKFESTLDEYLYDKQRDTTAAKEQPKADRGYGLMSLFRSKS